MRHAFARTLVPASVAAIALFASGAQAGEDYSVLYNFCAKGQSCPGGASPRAGLITDASGNLYGTTPCGGRENGSFPVAGLIDAGDGTDLYGTTSSGGMNGNGVVFEISGKHEEVLHVFSRIVGTSTTAPVLAIGATLYGTTVGGGKSGYGTVYELDTTGGGAR